MKNKRSKLYIYMNRTLYLEKRIMAAKFPMIPAIPTIVKSPTSNTISINFSNSSIFSGLLLLSWLKLLSICPTGCSIPLILSKLRLGSSWHSTDSFVLLRYWEVQFVVILPIVSIFTRRRLLQKNGRKNKINPNICPFNLLSSTSFQVCRPSKLLSYLLFV